VARFTGFNSSDTLYHCRSQTHGHALSHFLAPKQFFTFFVQAAHFNSIRSQLLLFPGVTFNVNRNAVVLTVDDFRKGATGPTDVEVGTTPTIALLRFDAVNELLSAFVAMPFNWSRLSDVELLLGFGLTQAQTNGDVLSINLDYTALEMDVPGGGFDRTSTNIVIDTELTTAKGLGTGDVYLIRQLLDKNDPANGFTDNTYGFGIQFNLANLVGVDNIHFIAGCIDYETID